jgi:hypothetical protein
MNGLQDLPSVLSSRGVSGALDFLRRLSEEHPDDPKPVTAMMYLLFNELLEKPSERHRHAEYRDLLPRLYESCRQKFNSDAYFLLITSTFVGAAEWLFGLGDTREVRRMRLAAYELDRNNPLFSWGVEMMGDARLPAVRDTIRQTAGIALEKHNVQRRLRAWGPSGEYVIQLLKYSRQSNSFE